MGIEAAETGLPVAGNSAGRHCADSGTKAPCTPDISEESVQTDTATATQLVKGEPVEAGGGKTREEEEEDIMSLFCERGPRDVIHFETLYDERTGLGENRGQTLLCLEHTCEEPAKSKALALQRQQEETVRALKKLNNNKNMREGWTYSSNYLGNGYMMTDQFGHSLLKGVRDANQNLPLGEDANGLLRLAPTDDKENVFVRRGCSEAWRLWQEILGQSKPEKKLNARYESSQPPLMFSPCSITVHLSIEGHRLKNDTRVFVEMRDFTNELLISGLYTTTEGYITLEFTSKSRGEANVSLKCVGLRASDIAPYQMCVDVFGNNPILSLSDDSSWPVSVAFDPNAKHVYVAFINYITKYSDGEEFVEYVCQLTQLTKGSYNDLALSPGGQTLVASYSGFHSEPVKYRYQGIHFYDSASGQLQGTIDNDFPLFIFDAPILHLCTKAEDSILVADHSNICEIGVGDGELKSRLKVVNMGSVSRMAYRHDRYYIADANLGYVKIYDQLGLLESCFQVSTPGGQPALGLSGLAVDKWGNVLVCDCLSGTVQVYRADGTLINALDSDWEKLGWPLHLATTDDGHVFVVDHRNACVKKYKYI